MPQIGGDIDEAAARLRKGEVVAFATETVYGLGADADNDSAVKKIYALKKRPANHPLIVHLADFSRADEWAKTIPDTARLLAETFLPGPLTILLPRRRRAALVAGGGDYVGLRVPSHPVARRLLQAFNKAVAAPSANIFGGLSPTTAAAAAAQFPRENFYIVDGGACRVGIESAIVQCEKDKVYLLRPGAIGAAAMEKIIQQRLLPPPKNATAPGLLARHYSPKTPLFTVDKKILNETVAHYQTVAVLSQVCPRNIPPQKWRRARMRPSDYARRLYELLRQLDDEKTRAIIVEKPPSTAAWNAVHDRLRRAGGQ